MSGFLRFVIISVLVLMGGGGLAAQGAEPATQPLRVVCVEAVWCNIIAQIGGEHVQTHALITTPGIDPHEFSPTPTIARALSEADIAVMNGATYDDWAAPFAAHAPDHVNIAEQAGWAPGMDAHMFLNPGIVRLFADQITQRLQHDAPTYAADFAANRMRFLADVDRVDARLHALQVEHAHLPYAATETQGTALFAQAGFDVLDARYAQAIAQHMAPSPRDEAKLETALQAHQLAFLVVNPEVRAPQLQRLEALAHDAAVPVIQLGETLPIGQSWQALVAQILDQTEKAVHASHL